MHTTPTDYAKFLIEILNPKPADEFRLEAPSLDEMIRPHVKVDDSHSWALGWKLYHDPQGPLLMHGGNQRGFHAVTVASIERRSGMVLMTNGDNGWKLNHRVAEEMAKPYLLR